MIICSCGQFLFSVDYDIYVLSFRTFLYRYVACGVDNNINNNNNVVAF